jgi:predicted transcriptional regulator
MASNNHLPPLSDVQLEIMNIVWDRSACSVADVWKVLSQRRGVARNTVHTLIARLEEKGWLRRRAQAGRLVYSATVSRETNQQQSVRRLVETVFDGSAEGLVLTLLNEPTISADDAERIRTLITQARKRKP